VPDAIHFTGDPDADALLARDPLALLIGFALDQQVTVQQAFVGPLRIQQRLGTLDAAKIAATDPGRLEEVFRERPAIHRFPGSMAKRVRALCALVADASVMPTIPRANTNLTTVAVAERLAETI